MYDLTSRKLDQLNRRDGNSSNSRYSLRKLVLLSNIFGSGNPHANSEDLERIRWDEERLRERERIEMEETRRRNEFEQLVAVSANGMKEKTDEDRWLDDVLQEMIDDDEEDYISVSFRDQDETVAQAVDSGFLERDTEIEGRSQNGKERYQGSFGRITEDESIDELEQDSSVRSLPIALIPNHSSVVPATSSIGYYAVSSYSPPLDPPPLVHSPPSLVSSHQLSISVEEVMQPYSPPLPVITSDKVNPIEQNDLFPTSVIVIPLGPAPPPAFITSESTLSLALSTPRKPAIRDRRWNSTIPRSLSVPSSPSSYINRTHPRSGIISSPSSRSTSPTSLITTSRSNSTQNQKIDPPLFPTFSTIQSFNDRVDFGIDPTAMDFWSHATSGWKNLDLDSTVLSTSPTRGETEFEERGRRDG